MAKNTEQANLESHNSSESEFQFLIEFAKDYAVFSLDAAGKVVSWNKGAAFLYGYTPGEVLGENVSIFYSKADAEAGLPAADLKAAKEKGRIETNKSHLKKSGAMFIADVILAVSDAGSGGFIYAVRNVTQQKTYEEELIKSNRELAHSNNELQQFAYATSHDLREPLRMVSNYVALLSKRFKDKLDEDGIQFIKYAEDGAVKAQRLIRELLEFSRIGTKGKPFDLCDLNHVLAGALNNLKPVIEESSALIVSDPLPTVNADGSQISQLFQYVIDNALKYRGQQPPSIKVECLEDDSQFAISVSDNGIGIDSRYFDRIFKIFQRLHLSNEYSGTGMGLAIAKRIVDRHRGSIWVESIAGKGSTFHFTIPKSIKNFS